MITHLPNPRWLSVPRHSTRNDPHRPAARQTIPVSLDLLTVGFSQSADWVSCLQLSTITNTVCFDTSRDDRLRSACRKLAPAMRARRGSQHIEWLLDFLDEHKQGVDAAPFAWISGQP